MKYPVLILAVLAAAGPALAAGTNEYGGYDIAAMSGASEAPYGEVRGWTAYSGTISGRFAYCAGETKDGDTIWRLGFDGQQWQLGVPYATGDGAWDGEYEVDGARKPASGTAANGWTFMWLGLQELDEVRNGNEIVLDIGRASIAHPLKGTAAIVTKIEECVARKGNASGAQVAAAKPAAASAPAGCPDKLPGTGLCPAEAAALIGGAKPSQEAFSEPYQNCSWAINETPFAGDYLLYYAAECKGRKSLLDYAGGAHFAELTVVESAFAEGEFTPPDAPLVRVAGTEPGDPEGSVLARARAAIEDPARAAMCKAQSGAEFGYPADSIVVDVGPEDAAKLSEDERMSGACGPFGAGDSARFWRVFQSFSWFFDLGQDAFQDIDAASLTLVTSDGKGGWKKAE